MGHMCVVGHALYCIQGFFFENHELLCPLEAVLDWTEVAAAPPTLSFAISLSLPTRTRRWAPGPRQSLPCRVAADWSDPSPWLSPAPSSWVCSWRWVATLGYCCTYIQLLSTACFSPIFFSQLVPIDLHILSMLVTITLVIHHGTVFPLPE
jgi:hypothetical protein